MSDWIGITAGDITGIGPEVVLKALALEDTKGDKTRYLILCDTEQLRRVNKTVGLTLQDFSEFTSNDRFCVLNPLLEPIPAGLVAGAAPAALAAIGWIRDGARRCMNGELAALVTAPLNKESVIRAGMPFVGQTELLAQLAGVRRSVMMLLGQDDRGHALRVALATTHLPLRRVADSLNRERVEQAIECAAQACSDLGLKTARVGVCGLNPHAGEGGHLGHEEIDIIRPAIEALRARGCDVTGPLAADALFHYAYRGDYDAVVAMYHDQGLAPLKMIGFDTGVNWTLGLPFIRTSPDHGTAYDIAGQNKANPRSMASAIRLARKLAARRIARENGA